ncbi:MAG: 50S ribosomal protein L12, partial [Nitrososphaerota archaeon]
MEYIYAALLLHKAGKPVNEEGIKSILSAAGIQPDDGRVKALVAALSEINIDEVLKSAAAAPFVAT